jgi:hypothetical protein
LLAKPEGRVVLVNAEGEEAHEGDPIKLWHELVVNQE